MKTARTNNEESHTWTFWVLMAHVNDHSISQLYEFQGEGMKIYFLEYFRKCYVVVSWKRDGLMDGDKVSDVPRFSVLRVKIPRPPVDYRNATPIWAGSPSLISTTPLPQLSRRWGVSSFSVPID